MNKTLNRKLWELNSVQLSILLNYYLKVSHSPTFCEMNKLSKMTDLQETHIKVVSVYNLNKNVLMFNYKLNDIKNVLH